MISSLLAARGDESRLPWGPSSALRFGLATGATTLGSAGPTPADVVGMAEQLGTPAVTAAMLAGNETLAVLLLLATQASTSNNHSSHASLQLLASNAATSPSVMLARVMTLIQLFTP